MPSLISLKEILDCSVCEFVENILGVISKNGRVCVVFLARDARIFYETAAKKRFPILCDLIYLPISRYIMLTYGRKHPESLVDAYCQIGTRFEVYKAYLLYSGGLISFEDFKNEMDYGTDCKIEQFVGNNFAHLIQLVEKKNLNTYRYISQLVEKYEELHLVDIGYSNRSELFFNKILNGLDYNIRVHLFARNGFPTLAERQDIDTTILYKPRLSLEFRNNFDWLEPLLKMEVEPKTYSYSENLKPVRVLEQKRKRVSGYKQLNNHLVEQSDSISGALSRLEVSVKNKISKDIYGIESTNRLVWNPILIYLKWKNGGPFFLSLDYSRKIHIAYTKTMVIIFISISNLKRLL